MLASSLSAVFGVLYSSNPPIFNDTVAGPVVSFLLHMGNTSFIRHVWYGRSTTPAEYSCVPWTNRTTATPSVLQVNCTLQPGFGKALYVLVETCMTIAGQTTCAQYQSAADGNSFGYRPPVFYACSLQLATNGVPGNCTAGAVDLSQPNTGAVLVAFTGNWIPDSSHLTVNYGFYPSAPFVCTPDPSTSQTQLVCLTASGSVGSGLSFQINAAGWTLLVSDTISFPV